MERLSDYNPSHHHYFKSQFWTEPSLYVISGHKKLNTLIQGLFRVCILLNRVFRFSISPKNLTL